MAQNVHVVDGVAVLLQPLAVPPDDSHVRKVFLRRKEARGPDRIISPKNAQDQRQRPPLSIRRDELDRAGGVVRNPPLLADVEASDVLGGVQPGRCHLFREAVVKAVAGAWVGRRQGGGKLCRPEIRKK